MYNYIEQHWRPEYDSDATLRSLRYRLRGVLERYEKIWRVYSDAEDAYAERKAEQAMEACSVRFNATINSIVEQFKSRVEQLATI